MPIRRGLLMAAANASGGGGGGGGPLSAVLLSSQQLVPSPDVSTYTVDCSTVTSSDLLVLLHQIDADTVSISSITAAGSAMSIDANSVDNPAHQDDLAVTISSIAGSAVAGNSNVSIVLTKNIVINGYESIQVFRLVDGATATVLSSATDIELNLDGVVMSVTVDFSAGFLFASAAYDVLGTNTYTGVETVYTGYVSGNGFGFSSDGATNSVPTSAAHTVTYARDANAVQTGSACALAAVVYSTGGGGGGTSDVTPDAVDWNNVAVADSFETTNPQTITGIDTPITLEVSTTETGANYLVEAYEGISTLLGSTNSPGSFTFTVSNGAEISFDLTGTTGQQSTGTVTITNVTDSNTVLDTFTVDLDDAPAADVTPNAVNWGNITGDTGSTNGTQTISGINTTITLQVNFTEDRDNYTLRAFVNGSVAAGPTNSPGTLTFNVSNNDTVNFRADTGGETRDSQATVINTSDGNATLDTFTIDIED